MMSAPLLEAGLTHLGAPKQGKVREMYDLGDCLLMVATDRISAFDVILPNGIPNKGQVLNQMSAFWFRRMSHLIPNHIISTDDQEVAARTGVVSEALAGRCALVHRCEPLPIEFVARGYVAGSLAKEIQAGGGKVRGMEFPPDAQVGDRLPEPIFTPATKAETGHDINVDFDHVVGVLGPELAERTRDLTLALYSHAARHAESCGLILADTKFEFGLRNGELVWIDEALTPDSSRYWEAKDWRPGAEIPSFDKQFVRDWLEQQPWDKTAPGPVLPDEVVSKTREKYLEAFKRITGRDL